MFKISRTLMMAGIISALTACGGGGGGGGEGDGSSASPTPSASGIGTFSLALSSPSVRSPSETVVLTITLTNTSGSDVAGGALTLALPAGVKSMSAMAVGSPCTSTGFSVGNSGFVLTGLVVPVGATCTNTVTLTPSTPGTFSFPSTASFMNPGTTTTLLIQ